LEPEARALDRDVLEVLVILVAVLVVAGGIRGPDLDAAADRQREVGVGAPEHEAAAGLVRELRRVVGEARDHLGYLAVDLAFEVRFLAEIGLELLQLAALTSAHAPH